MTNRRINEVIGIRYDDIAKIPAIITEVEAMLKAHKEIDQSQALRVYFNYFNASYSKACECFSTSVIFWLSYSFI
jgi:MscS family membrane protein